MASRRRSQSKAYSCARLCGFFLDDLQHLCCPDFLPRRCYSRSPLAEVAHFLAQMALRLDAS